MNQISNNYTLYTDGGSRGNPGPAAYGYVIYNADQEIIAEAAQYIGVTTNNQAEYQGIVAALEWLATHKPSGSIVCYLDSQLVVRQINGMYKMKSVELKPWLDKVKSLIKELDVPIQFLDVRREENKYADKLVNAALDAFKG